MQKNSQVKQSVPDLLCPENVQQENVRFENTAM